VTPNRARALVIVGLAITAAALAAFLLRRAPVQKPLPPSEPERGAVDAPADASRALVDARSELLSEPDEPVDDSLPESLEAQRERLLRRVAAWYEPPPQAMARLRQIFAASSLLGQGNPAASEYAITRSACRDRRAEAGAGASGDPRCGARNMVPLYDPKRGENAESARVCIDQYEFPNIPCEYPVVYARSNESMQICRALGKRLCDAHEWEGACAGALRPADEEYDWGKPRNLQSHLHNQKREITWAYGPKKNHALCATGSSKSRSCLAGGWRECGSNTYPAGAFPECKSPLGVFDLHGNAAEHMNLPLVPEELASRGGSGKTEMKGSWFIFSRGEAHIDDCRWRAPSWHETALMAEDSHRNYHLGFRCCKEIAAD
jgi:formylglycine-generating enzyme